MTALCMVSISQADWGDPTYDVGSICHHRLVQRLLNTGRRFSKKD